MRREGVDFAEALRMLAQRAGVTLDSDQGQTRKGERQRLYEANEAAARFYHRYLLHDPAAEDARQYLAQRGLDMVTIQAFGLGLSPSAWSTLRSHLHQGGFSDQEMMAAGLLVEGERGYYDRFRGRLMFPIRDEKGRVVGFGARSLDGSQPKYLNTPQTALFDKGGLLYGLDRAGEHIRRQDLAVIVEGYMDVIAAHQHGFGNVVASMGTALTERQVGLLKRYTRNLALALDADAAGSAATLHGLEVVAQTADRELLPVPGGSGVIHYQETLAADIRVVSLPQGQDPDQLIRASPQRWAELLAGAKPVVEHLFDSVTGRLDLSQPWQRSQAVQELLPVVAEIGDRVVQAHYLQRLARLAQVSERALEDELRARRRRGSRGSRRGAPTSPGVAAVASVGDSREEYTLALLLRYPGLRSQGLTIDEGVFSQSENRQVFAAWRQADDPDDLRRRLPPELLAHFERLSQRPLPTFSQAQAEEALRSCLHRIEQQRLAMWKRATLVALQEQEAAGDASLAVELARRAWETSREELAEDASGRTAALYLQDMELALRLHSPERRRTEISDGVADARGGDV